MTRRNLAIVRAGDSSWHETWLSDPAKKNFDLFVAYYGTEPDKWRSKADRYDHTKGLKYPWFNTYLASNPWILEYDAVWLCDDDIEADTPTLSDMFDIFHENHLWIGQAALTRNSIVAYEMLVRVQDSLLRHVGFIEEQMPIFSRETLLKIKHAMGETISGWGLGIAWPQMLGYPKDKLGVIDACPVRHTRAHQTSDMYTVVLPSLNADPFRDLAYMREKYQDDMRQVVFNGVSLDPSHPLTTERRKRQER